MNSKRIVTIAGKSILILTILVGGLGFTQASGKDTAATEPPEPYLVKDISTKGIGPPPRQLTDVNGTLFFYAYDGVHGWELWKSDGTADGTLLVKDINPGGEDSWVSSELTNVNGTLFFSAMDHYYDFELWKSDGTAEGTVMVKDLYPGSDGSSPEGLTEVNGTLFFSAYGEFGVSLWMSDGTADGTVMVKEFSYGVRPEELTAVNGTLFFSADDGVHGRELWVSDGTPDGTVMVKDIRPGDEHDSSNPSDLTDVNGMLFFSAYDDIHGLELWVSDGTPDGTLLVKDIYPSGSSNTSNLTAVNGTLFFSAEDDLHGSELWVSDGSADGTLLVKDINPDWSGSYPSYLTDVNGTLFFGANDGVHGRGLWKSDGTAAGTLLVKDIDPEELTDVDGTLFLSAHDDLYGSELWVSDGTPDGTLLVKDIYSGGDGIPYDASLTSMNGTLFFNAEDGLHGQELWVSDGTSGGTLLVKDINPTTESSEPQEFANVNGTLFFSANDYVHGWELWVSDGSPDGTLLVKDIKPGGEWDSSSPYYLTAVNGTLFFRADDGYQRGLWKSDGTHDGTQLVQYVNPSELTDVNGTLFFSADDDVHGNELWKSDGTPGGTVLVKDIYPGDSSWPEELTAVNGTLFFRADDGVHDRELWVSDGTPEGTVMVKDINPGAEGDGSYPRFLTDVNGTLFFSAQDDLHGEELWKSDGTTDGTVMVKDIYPTGEGYGSNPSFLADVNGTLFFSARDGVHGEELWKSDGTPDGTLLVKDINPWDGSYPEELTNVNGTLFFSASGEFGEELWKSDGTADGTVMVKDFGFGVRPRELTDVNGTLFFRANDGIHGDELWVSDGTPDGTLLVKDIYPGGEGYGSNPSFLIGINGTLFLSADDGIHGDELWALDTWEPYLWIDPPDVDLPIGYEFTVDIMVAEVRDLYGVELQLSFDPALTEVVDSDPEVDGIQIQPGDCPAPDSVVVNSADNTAGTISYAVTSLTPTLPCTGEGVIASVTFHGLAEGISPLHFNDFLLTDEELNPISVESVQDGSLNVYQAAGITVTPSSGLETTEGGGTDTFTVVLDSQPSDDVLIRLTSSDPSEGTASRHWLFFSSSSWDKPKTVTIKGVNDFVDDGDIPYTIVTDPAISDDPNYAGLNAADVAVTNTDDDVAGITVIPTADLVTTEGGGTDTFTVVLDSQPLEDVTIELSSSDTSEGTVSPSSLTFTQIDWDAQRIVTITGVDDGKVDGDIAYTIITDPAVSEDPKYDGLDAADVSVTNNDDDVVGILVTPISGLVTSEWGDSDTFEVVLTSQPSADVIIGLSSSDPSEGTVSRNWLFFTSATWNVPKVVKVTGVDDFVDDGNITFAVLTAPAISNDPDYRGRDAADVAVTNIDDDGHGITVTPPAGLVTSEAGGTDTFSVKLNSQPLADVIIGLRSSDNSEGTVTPQWLTFSPTNWNIPKDVNVVGVDDFVDDGDIIYTIITAPAISADPNYNGENAVDVSVTNTDDDVVGIKVEPISGLETTEQGGTDTFTMVLTSQPTADVTVGLSCTDTTEGMISKNSLTFTELTWDTPQLVTITGMDDEVVDGDIAYMILTASANSDDPDYDGLNTFDVSVTNLDDDEPVFIIFLPTINGD